MKKDVAQPQVKKPRPNPTPQERQAMTNAHERFAKRSAPFRWNVEATSEGAFSLDHPHSDHAGHMLHGLDTFGTASLEFRDHCMGRLGAVMRDRKQPLPDGKTFNASLAAVSGIAPENEIEAMLAVQMVGTHEVAMEMLTRAKLANDSDHMERYGTFATKLLRTYTAQIEALAKLRRGGAQKVVVEHVHVYQGGQAIVGNVNGKDAKSLPGGGDEQRNRHQPYELTGPAAVAFQADPSMLREDAGGDPMPVASRAGENAMPQARRGRGKRGAAG